MISLALAGDLDHNDFEMTVCAKASQTNIRSISRVNPIFYLPLLLSSMLCFHMLVIHLMTAGLTAGTRFGTINTSGHLVSILVHMLSKHVKSLSISTHVLIFFRAQPKS